MGEGGEKITARAFRRGRRKKLAADLSDILHPDGLKRRAPCQILYPVFPSPTMGEGVAFDHSQSNIQVPRGEQFHATGRNFDAAKLQTVS